MTNVNGDQITDAMPLGWTSSNHNHTDMNQVVLDSHAEFTLYVYASLSGRGTVTNDVLHSWNFSSLVDNDITNYLNPGQWDQSTYPIMLGRMSVETGLRSPNNLFTDQDIYHGPETIMRDLQTGMTQNSSTAEIVAVINVHFTPYSRTTRPNKSHRQKRPIPYIKC